MRVQQALSALSKVESVDPQVESVDPQVESVDSTGKTVIMIAHRLSSITDADCIYVLQDGEIAESGTYSELIEKNGIFTKMWKNYSEAAAWRLSSEDQYLSEKDIGIILNENKGLEVNA